MANYYSRREISTIHNIIDRYIRGSNIIYRLYESNITSEVDIEFKSTICNSIERLRIPPGMVSIDSAIANSVNVLRRNVYSQKSIQQMGRYDEQARHMATGINHPINSGITTMANTSVNTGMFNSKNQKYKEEELLLLLNK